MLVIKEPFAVFGVVVAAAVVAAAVVAAVVVVAVVKLWQYASNTLAQLLL